MLPPTHVLAKLILTKFTFNEFNVSFIASLGVIIKMN